MEKYETLQAFGSMYHARTSEQNYPPSRGRASSQKNPTIQLWTDENAKEFAVRLSTDPDGLFRAASDLGADYINLASEIAVTRLNTQGWDHMLENFSVQWIANAEHQVDGCPASKIPKSLANESREHRNGVDTKHVLLLRVQRDSQRRIRPQLQCHFCRLRYFAEGERAAHEEMWHAAKLQKLVATKIPATGGLLGSSTS